MEKFNIMKLKDFAKEIGISVNTVRTWRQRGNIPKNCFIVIGSTVFVKANEIRQWIEQTA